MNITSDDPRLTAYALGELDEAGQSVMEAEMRNFAERRREVEEIIRAVALVRAGLASEPAPGLTAVQQRAIETKLGLAGSKPKLSWLPSARTEGLRHWRLKAGLTVMAVLLIHAFAFATPITGRTLGLISHATACMAYEMIRMTGTPVIKNGLELTVPNVMKSGAHSSPGMTFEVAPSCEGIAFMWSLLVASLLVGNLFLQSPWRRLLLTLFVIPLGIIWSGFRVFTLVELCAHGDAGVVDSPLHHHGGLIFFALSLIPFICFLAWLRRSES